MHEILKMLRMLLVNTVFVSILDIVREGMGPDQVAKTAEAVGVV
jgi:hypothetical protein